MYRFKTLLYAGSAVAMIVRVLPEPVKSCQYPASGSSDTSSERARSALTSVSEWKTVVSSGELEVEDVIVGAGSLWRCTVDGNTWRMMRWQNYR
jgi:hypothetical protein